MPWPLSQDYNEAIQSPASSFSDPELKQGEATTNAIGLPMPRSGNFADVYEFNCPATKRKWAIKCFTREVPGLRERYSEISSYLQQVKLPFMVDFNYLDQGIKVRGQWFPILKMHWVEGSTLNEFVNKYADQPVYLDMLCQIWVRLARRLREAKIAHGDLQHGNVLLVPGSTAKSLGVRLIDYDGMCVPALAQKKSGELGHPAYQHPQRLREGTYSVDVDRFPHLVIYTALRALIVRSRYLWNRYDNSDNLLFRQQDLNDPANSALFKELQKLNDSEVGKLVETLSQASQQPLEQTPLLDELVTNKTAVTPRRRTSAAIVEATAAAPASAESIFAEATAGEGDTPSSSRVRGRGVRKSYGWIWATAAVLLLGVGLAGVLFLGGKDRPKVTSSDVLVAQTEPATVQKNVEVPPKGQGTVKKDAEAPKKAPPITEPAQRLTLFPIPAVTIKAGEATLLEVRYDAGQSAAIPSIDFQGYSAGLQFQRQSIDTQKAVYKLIASAEAENSTRQVQVTLSLNDKQTQGQVQITVQKRETVVQPSGSDELRQFVGHNGPVWSVAFSSDGKRIVSGSSDRTLKVWNAQTGQLERTLQGHSSSVLSVAFSPDGKRIVSGSQDKTMRLWDTETGKELRQFENHTDTVWTVAFSPDGLDVFSGCRDKTARLWNTNSGKELQRFEGHTGCPHAGVFSPDGHHMLTGSCDRTVRLWDTKTGKLLRRFAGHTHQVNSLAFRPDGRSALSGSWDKTLRLWDVQTGMELRRFEGHTDLVHSIAISPDGRLALSGGGGQDSGGKTIAGTDNSMRLWDLESGKELRRFNGHADMIRSVAFSPDGRRALSGSNDRTIRLWALPGGIAASDDIATQFQLRKLQVVGGPHRVGDKIIIIIDLANISGKDLPIPVDKNNASKPSSVGTRQRWIEKLDGDPTIPAMSPKIARSGKKYAVGGELILTPPVVPKDQILRANPAVPTTGYLPGRYRYYVDYRKSTGEVIQTEHVDFELLPHDK